ncbi:MAG TPA: SOS response-associated peptidase [Paracoccus sp. (in: a-proteobacteria)]|nr:SOS response-associated peptidase [Paracoccus sp. (in: a-proteobacteria)]
MCNLYSQTRGQQAIREIARAMHDLTGNLPPLPGIYPDQQAPIVRNGKEGVRELAMARWGMPTPPMHMKTARDPGVTNIRNTGSPHWRRWLGPEHRCLVPLTSFSEPGPDRKPVWFKPAEDRPLFFAGLETRAWRSVRKVKDGETVDDLFAFLTTTPNAEVGAIHPKAMPVILAEPDDWEMWMTAPWSEARGLQRPLPDGFLETGAEPT